MKKYKRCSRCGLDLPLRFFHERKGKRAGEPQSNCKACQRELADKWKARNQERVKLQNKRADLKRRYGITLEEYEALCATADHRCQACGATGRLCVDHDHETGVVRGMLCDGCNKGLGFFGDDVARLRAAADYLERKREVEAA